MKTHSVIITALAVATSLLADTLQIGAFTLPYRFEDSNITDIVRYVVTNDIIAYSTPIAAFRPPYQDKYGNICVQRINIPPIIDRSELFNDGIKFYIENGQTNCIIKQSLTDAAKAIESELPFRTNLLAQARAFVDNYYSGAVTNETGMELRRSVRVFRTGELRYLDENKVSNDMLVAGCAEDIENMTTLPLCTLDLIQTSFSTNTVYIQPVRTEEVKGPKDTHSILAIRLVYFDGCWSFLR